MYAEQRHLDPNQEKLTELSFIQLSGMTLGAMIEADRRIREYEFMMRRMKKIKADEEVWKRWEEDIKKVR